ncbi:MAG: hypothetical protein V2I41_16005 [Pseudomonadales bacterium]|nr:hypothetical protein [Pseudomonadales bacterium]
MGIDRIQSTLPTYTSLQRRGRVRKGKGSSEDDIADESQSDKVDGQVTQHADSKRAEQDKDEDNSDEDGGHIDEHV